MNQLTLPNMPPCPNHPTPAVPKAPSRQPLKSPKPKNTKPADLFTAEERHALRLVITTVQDSLRWNGESGLYEDDGSFILSLEKDEMIALNQALKKF